MQFCDETIEILKQYSKINTSLFVSEGNIIRTVSPGQDLFARASVPEEFEYEFGIYDLNRFINCIGLFDEPDLVFDERKVKISDKKSGNELEYYYSDLELIQEPPKKDPSLEGIVAEFDMSADELKKLQQSAAVLGVTKLAIKGDENGLMVSVLSDDNSSPHSFSSTPVDSVVNKEFALHIKVENMWIKLFNKKGHFTVYDIGSDNGVLKVDTGTTKVDMTYWMAGSYEG